ncbi:hypothetical protein PILCRDRAFT_7198 [Piloderma croceum F 1598]|uniref:Uncharacterized protein n=1 Tax=Piloderma croceum (strain F 1598) TaxID=765440 RepID=A0A0C3FYE7_PILCF|nr:hypothetical protein PILCRDRAFT_7198 [Piloderma croceum F 1598]
MASEKNLKRPRPRAEEDTLPPQSLLENFSELSKEMGSPEAAILSLMRFFSIEVDSIKSPLPDKLASFSNAEYEKIAPFFNMNPEYRASDWEIFSIPRVSLPNSIKDELLKAGAKAFRQSGPPSRQPNEGTRVEFLGTWLPEIIPLFLGRLYDRSEKPMPGTELSSGGRVEHEVFMWERVIVFLIEVKLEVMSGPKYWNFLAQVMCELESACQMNRRIDIQDFAIYAVLTDTKQWEFLAYDGAQRKFYRDEPISLSGPPLEDHWLYIRRMVQVCSRIFGLLLQGYINTLKAYATKSFQRGEVGDNNLKRSSSVPVPISKKKGSSLQRPSTDVWETLAAAAEHCQERFNDAFQLMQNKEKKAADEMAEEALALLRTSVKQLDLDDGLDEVEKLIEDWRVNGDDEVDT